MTEVVEIQSYIAAFAASPLVRWDDRGSELQRTGSEEFGALVGDDSHIGANAVVAPGAPSQRGIRACRQTELGTSMATIHLVFGSQGAGKTTYSRQLAERTESTRFSIDDWMGELYGPDLPKPWDFAWIMERVRRCESRIWSTAAEIVQRGGSVVLDLGFMKVSDRSRFVALAAAKALPLQMHFVTAPHELRRSRVLSRNTSQGETFSFEVTSGMFDFMEKQFEQPTEAEGSKSTVFSSE